MVDALYQLSSFLRPSAKSRGLIPLYDLIGRAENKQFVAEQNFEHKIVDFIPFYNEGSYRIEAFDKLENNHHYDKIYKVGDIGLIATMIDLSDGNQEVFIFNILELRENGDIVDVLEKNFDYSTYSLCKMSTDNFAKLHNWAKKLHLGTSGSWYEAEISYAQKEEKYWRFIDNEKSDPPIVYGDSLSLNEFSSIADAMSWLMYESEEISAGAYRKRKWVSVWEALFRGGGDKEILLNLANQFMYREDYWSEYFCRVLSRVYPYMKDDSLKESRETIIDVFADYSEETLVRSVEEAARVKFVVSRMVDGIHDYDEISGESLSGKYYQAIWAIRDYLDQGLQNNWIVPAKNLEQWLDRRAGLLWVLRAMTITSGFPEIAARIYAEIVVHCWEAFDPKDAIRMFVIASEEYIDRVGASFDVVDFNQVVELLFNYHEQLELVRDDHRFS